MIGYFFNVAIAGLWAEVWRYGIGTGLILLCLAAAYFSPIWKKDFLWLAIIIAVFMAAFTSGVIIGEKRVHAQWDAATKYKIGQDEKARSRADRYVARKHYLWMPNRRDGYDRDRG